MRNHNFLPFFVVVFAFLGFVAGTTYSQPEDSVWVSSVNPVPPETTVTVQVRLKTTFDLAALVIPLKFRNENNLEVTCDSVQWSEDWFLASGPSDYSGMVGNMAYIDDDEKLVKIYAILFGDPLPPGDDTLCTIYFTTGMFWYPESAVALDRCSNDPGDPADSLVLVDDTYEAIIPGFVPGFLGPAFIPELGDVDCSREITISDVYYLTVYLFKFGPAPCYEEWVGDVNCDDNVDIVDVVYLVRYLFRGGPSPCEE